MQHDPSFLLHHAQQREQLPTRGPPAIPPQSWRAGRGTQPGHLRDVGASSGGAQGTELQQCWEQAQQAPGQTPSLGPRGRLHQNPALVLQCGSSGSTAMHRALCCPWMPTAPGADVFGVVSEEMEQNTPFLHACNPASSAGENGVPSNTPHPSSLHGLGVGSAAPPQCRGRACLWVLTVFAR